MKFIEAVNKAYKENNENKTLFTILLQKDDENHYFPVWVYKSGTILFSWNEFSVNKLNSDDWEIE